MAAHRLDTASAAEPSSPGEVARSTAGWRTFDGNYNWRKIRPESAALSLPKRSGAEDEPFPNIPIWIVRSRCNPFLIGLHLIWQDDTPSGSILAAAIRVLDSDW